MDASMVESSCKSYLLLLDESFHPNVMTTWLRVYVTGIF